jgi:predicted enzyme related to lactoylglutathione lyase
MSSRVVHFEIPVDDAARAQAFYEQVFGWDAQPLPGMSYTTVATGPMGDMGPSEPGYIGGGLFQRHPGGRHPTVVVAVDNVESALEQVVAHGGTVVQGRMPVADMGFTGYFTDSEGNTIGLWENA